MSTTRTGPTVRKLVSDLQDDLADVVTKLRGARELLSVLEEDARGINGTSSVLKAKGSELDKMISDLTEEAEEVEKKMLGTKRPEITSSVDKAHAKAVSEAR